MHIDSTPRKSVLNTDSEKSADSKRKQTNPSVAPSTEKIFSSNHLSGDKSAAGKPNKTADTAQPPKPTEDKIFQQKALSQRLQRAEEKARLALGSEENKMYQTHLGVLSPDAESAVRHYNALFYTKSTNPGTPNAAREAFDEKFITPDEEQGWQDIQRQTSASLVAHGSISIPIGSINASELSSAIFREPGFSMFSGTMAGDKFIQDLMQVVTEKAATMDSTDHGMALVFRFPGTYGEVGHIAVGSLWRDESGTVRLDVSHQESMAPTPQSGHVYTGRIFDTFDTAAHYPTGIAPVVESMKLFGPPSVNVFPVPFPERLAPYTRLFKDHEVTYGPTEDWLPGQKSTLSKKMHNETCFNVTHKTLARLFGMTTPHEPLLPTLFPKMKGFAGIPKEKFTEFKVKGVNHGLEQTASDKALAIAAFMNIGANWVEASNADVRGSTRLKSVRLKFQPGQSGFQLPDQVTAFKFSSEAPMLKDLRLDGKAIIRGKVYSADEAARIKYTGKEPSKEISYLISLPAQNRAKL